MRTIDYGVGMEKMIRDTYQQYQAVGELKTLISLLIRFENNIINILQKAAVLDEGASNYPAVDQLEFRWIETEFKDALQVFEYQTNADKLLVMIWMIHSTAERSAQFYQQAAFNCAHPVEKMFFTSLFELKKLIKRRVDAFLRVLYNDAWAKVGFATFSLQKE